MHDVNHEIWTKCNHVQKLHYQLSNLVGGATGETYHKIQIVLCKNI